MPPRYRHFCGVLRLYDTSIDGRLFSGVWAKSEITDYVSKKKKWSSAWPHSWGTTIDLSTSKLNKFQKERLLFIGGNLIIGL
ncbi:DEHA2C11748p [Debaryomyces hansenii CBS767]|uniref:DEHA2C11748p n=1 Tax=Debaryomyces hansenii (strain ATCC 36239 / CBS 767 / BCRC 21394 / JCM 1990 / NBRC 0083 / IGC 2968) TaxID=284592 RepID=Q6BUD4_DEBHA|nr:DEHA2C11748p [Debaryomyces hansenii CBS767]CAG86261.1 DEHA2C11748p [Debaryomyces hansenii CBS767]|eukprot:XP_458185.1 DEHA2C11748p [Debaryomyces hansenii CBS767]